jgi:phenylalanyl-tRNA synthetase beta chain
MDGGLMPLVEFSKSKLARLIGKRIPNEKMLERLTMYGLNVEADSPATVTLEVTPNRPDLMSEEGLARAMRGFLGVEKGLVEYKVKKSQYKAVVDPSVKGVRESTSAAVVKGVRLDSEGVAGLMQAQEKLHLTHSRNRKLAAIGVHDLDVIKFPVKYTTVGGDAKFTPLDSGNMTVREILTKHPKGRDYAHLLPGSRYPVWQDADGKILSLPPIINSAHTAITARTKNLFIDLTGQQQKTVDQAMNILCAQLADAGGEVFSVTFNDGRTTPDLNPTSMKLYEGYANKLLGTRLTRKQIDDYLGRMRFSVSKERVLVPRYRTDILHPIDLVEDIAIAYGYENFAPEIPNVATVGGEARSAVLERKLAEVLTSLGLLETNTYHISNKAVLLGKMGRGDRPAVTARNAVNENYDTLRDFMVPMLLDVLSSNKHHDYPQNLFEIGSVVFPEKGAIREEEHLAIVVCHAKTDFTDIKSTAEALFKAMGVPVSVEPAQHEGFLAGRCANIMHRGKFAGMMGEIHPQVLENFALELPVTALEVKTEVFR